MTGRRRPGVLAVLTMVLSLLTASLAAPTPREAEAADPFTTAITVFRLFQGMSRRAQTYEQLNAALADERARLDESRLIAAQQQRTGILSPSDYLDEVKRINQLDQAYIDITERLKQLTKRQTDRFIGSTVLNAAVQQLSTTSGFVKVANDVSDVFEVANEGLRGIIDNVSVAGVDLIGRINDLQETLEAAAGALGVIGGRAGDDIGRALANVSRLLGEGVSVAEDVRAEILDELEQALAQVEELQTGYHGMLERIDSWGVGELRIDLTKFDDPRTVGMWQEINRYEGSRNGQAVINGWATRAHDRVRAAAGATNLSDEDVQAIASMAAQIITRTLLDDRRRPEVWEIDLAVWQALNMWLTITGRDPIASVQYAGEWHSAAACDEPETGWEHRWSVDLDQDPAGVVTGTIRYHECPGGGRAEYSVHGVATAATSIRLFATQSGGAGDLGRSAPRQRVMWITPDGMPSFNLAP